MRAACRLMALLVCLLAVAGPCCSQSPESPALRFEQAQRALASGRLDEAIAIYQQLIAADKTSVPLRVGLGVAYYQKGDYAQAVDALVPALKIEPNTPAGQAFLGLSEAALGKGEAAIAPLAAGFQS